MEGNNYSDNLNDSHVKIQKSTNNFIRCQIRRKN